MAIWFIIIIKKVSCVSYVTSQNEVSTSWVAGAHTCEQGVEISICFGRKPLHPGRGVPSPQPSHPHPCLILTWADKLENECGESIQYSCTLEVHMTSNLSNSKGWMLLVCWSGWMSAITESTGKSSIVYFPALKLSPGYENGKIES